MSIAFVIGSASRLAGGLFNSMRKSALALLEEGHRVTVLALHDAYAVEDSGAWAPLRLRVAARRGPAALGYGPGIGASLRGETFDLVHQHGIWQAFSGQVSNWRRRTGGKVMISTRGMLDPWAVRNAGWKKQVAGSLYERSNLGAAQCLHALDGAEAAAIRAFGLANPIAIIPNGADLPSDVDGPPPAWWPNSKVLLFIGRIHPKKGVVELVEAFARMRKAAPPIGREWTLVIGGWGDGGHVSALRAAVDRHGLEGHVLLPVPIYGEEKYAALRHASAFVLPSYSEGMPMPMSVLEAWAYKLPVLMTDECNLPEGFATGAAARITTDADALASQLKTLLSPSSAETLAEMGQRGRMLVEADYGWSEIARRHVDVYRWMVAGGPQAPSCVRLG